MCLSSIAIGSILALIESKELFNMGGATKVNTNTRRKKKRKIISIVNWPTGNFRTMTLRAGVEADKVKETCKDGVLQISMPAPKELTPKRVQIEAK